MAVAPVAVVLYDLVFEFDSPAEALAVAEESSTRASRRRGWSSARIMWRWPRSTVGGTAVSPLTYLLNQAQMIARYLLAVRLAALARRRLRRCRGRCTSATSCRRARSILALARGDRRRARPLARRRISRRDVLSHARADVEHRADL